MQKIENLGPAKSVRLTKPQNDFSKNDMQRLGIKFFADYVRKLIDMRKVRHHNGGRSV